MQFFNSLNSRLGRVVTLAIAALFVAACGSSSSSSSSPEAQIRVVHAVADAPRVNVYLNDDLVLEDFDFRSGTGVIPIDAGSYNVRVEAIIPEPGTNIDVIDAANVPFDEGTQTTVYATGTTSPLAIAPVLINDPVGDIPADSFRATVVHAAAGVGEVAVFVTPPGADIGTSAPLGTVTFGGDPLIADAVPEGTYQIRIAVPPASGPYTDDDVVFNSGDVPLPAGADLQIAAVLNTTNGDSPVSLVVLDGEGSSDLFDAGTGDSAPTGALVRVVHASPDAPPVDVVVNDDFMNLIPELTNRAYTQVTDFLGPLPADTYNFKVVPTGTMNAVLDFDEELMSGAAYTVLAYDLLGAPIKDWVLVDDNRRVATEAKLRIVHASPEAGNVDVYLVPEGVLPTDSGVTPALGNVPFGAETGFFGVVPGTYDVYVTEAGEPANFAISVTDPGITIDASGIYTAIARDDEGGGEPLGLILADDFVAP